MEQHQTVLDEALQAARKIDDESQSDALITIANELSEVERLSVLNEALEAAGKIQDKSERVDAFISVAKELPDSERQPSIQKALEVVQRFLNESDRAESLKSVFSQLPASEPQLIKQAIQIAQSIEDKESRITVLTHIAFRCTENFVLHLSSSQLSTALEIIPNGTTSIDQSRLLSALAPRPSPGLFPRALQLVQTKITHPAYQAECIGNLAIYLPSEFLSEALEIVQADIPGYTYPTQALCYLIPYLSLEQLQKALDISQKSCLITHPDLLSQLFHQAARRLSKLGIRQSEPDNPDHREQIVQRILTLTQQHLISEKAIADIFTALAPNIQEKNLQPFQEAVHQKLKSEFYCAQVLAAIVTSSHLTPKQRILVRKRAKELQEDRPKATALSAFIPILPEGRSQVIRREITKLIDNATNRILKADLTLILATRPYPKSQDYSALTDLKTDQTRVLRLTREELNEITRANFLVQIAPHLLPSQILEAQGIAQDIQDRYHRARSLLALATHFPEIRAEAERQIGQVKNRQPNDQEDEARDKYVILHIELLSQFATTVPEQIPTLLKAVKEWADQNQFKEDPKEPDSNTYKRRRILIALKPHLPIRLVREIDRETGIGKAPQDLWERALFVLRNEYRQALKIGSLRNDATQDEDLLNLKDEINALTEMLLMRDLEPPVAVGILGGWGGGKSYIMHLMQSHMTTIRSQGMEVIDAWGLKDENSTSSEGDRVGRFVGHIYQIKFDAWTYAKANLWASLMQEIFYELNRQISLEQKLGHILSNSHQSLAPETAPDGSAIKQRSESYLEQFIYDPLSNTKKTIKQSIQQISQHTYERLTILTQKILNFWIVQLILHIILLASIILDSVLLAPIRYIFKKFSLTRNISALITDRLRQQLNKYYFPHDLPNQSKSNRKFNRFELVLQKALFLIFVGFPKRLNDRRKYWKQISDTKLSDTQDSTLPESEPDPKNSMAFGQALREGGELWQALYLINEEERTAFLESKLRSSHLKDWRELASKTEISNSLWNFLKQVKEKEKQILEQKEQLLAAKEKELQHQLKKSEKDVNQRLAQLSFTALWKPIINAIAKLHFSDKKIKEFTEAGKTYTMVRQTVTSWQGLLALFTMTLLIVLTLDSANRTAIIVTAQALLAKFGIAADWFNKLIPRESILIWFTNLPQWSQEILNKVPAAIQILAAMTATITALLPILKSLGNYITSVQKEQAEIQSKREVWLKQDKVTAELIQEVASLKLQVDEQRREVGLTADFSSLLDFVNSRLKDGNYSKHLGLMHQFKDDLWKLSNNLLPPASASEFKAKLDKLQQIFPRGPARVVVYIDDLDRCPPNTVVKVLEAV